MLKNFLSYNHVTPTCSNHHLVTAYKGVSLGSNIVSGPLDDEPDIDVPPDGLTDMESIMGLII